jgi:hypothetical protein
MIHPMVLQLRFTRSEFRRAIRGISEADAMRRLQPLNCVSWTVGHLAWQEQRYFLLYAQGTTLIPELQERYRYGAPPSAPSLAEMWSAWERVTRSVDPWLDGLSVGKLQEAVLREGTPTGATWGSLLHRVIYHYWYHTGENMALRKMLGHQGLPSFVGDIDEQAPYTPEAAPAIRPRGETRR